MSWKKNCDARASLKTRLVEGPLCFCPGHFHIFSHRWEFTTEEHLAGPQWLRKVVSHTAVFVVSRNALTYMTTSLMHSNFLSKKHLGVGVWELRTWAVPSLPQIAPIQSLALQITLRQR